MSWDRTEVLKIIARCGFDEIQACTIMRIVERESEGAELRKRLAEVGEFLDKEST